MKQRGIIIWLTGLPASGKTTIAQLVHAQLEKHGDDRATTCALLDGDEIRQWLSSDLGFSPADRKSNAIRAGALARKLARGGTNVIIALVSPYRESRDNERRIATAQGIPFLEVYLKASVPNLAARDIKDLYRRAHNGELKDFTGVSAPYEEPLAADVVLRTDSCPAIECAAQILATLECRGLVLRDRGDDQNTDQHIAASNSYLNRLPAQRELRSGRRALLEKRGVPNKDGVVLGLVDPINA